MEDKILSNLPEDCKPGTRNIDPSLSELEENNDIDHFDESTKVAASTKVPAKIKLRYRRLPSIENRPKHPRVKEPTQTERFACKHCRKKFVTR